jgi:hypothetical protein
LKKSQSRCLLAGALERAGVPVKLIIYDTGGHGFSLGRGNPSEGWKDAFVAWLFSAPFPLDRSRSRSVPKTEERTRTSKRTRTIFNGIDIISGCPPPPPAIPAVPAISSH